MFLYCITLSSSRENQRSAQEVAGGAPTPLGAPSYLVAVSLLPRRPLQVSWIAFVPKIMFPKVSSRLDSVWYSFSAKL